MKRYLLAQWLQRIFYGGAIVTIILLIIFLVWYMTAKPPQSKLTLTDYSRITFGDFDCTKIDQLSTSTLSEQFPLTLSYTPDGARLRFSNYNYGETIPNPFNARLHILGAKEVFITIINHQNKDQKPETLMLPFSQDLILDIQAEKFDWSTNILPNEFDEVEGIAIRPTPTPIPTVEYTDYWDYNDCLYDCGGDYSEPDEFEWIPEQTKVSYSVGLCGEELAYYPKYLAASLDTLQSIGITVKPINYYSNKTAFLITFENLKSINISGQSIPLGDTAVIRIVMDIPEQDGFENTNSPFISMIATHLSSTIANGDHVSGSWPGTIDTYTIDQDEDKRLIDNSYYYSFEYATINANRIYIDSPKGKVVSNFPQVQLPDNSDQMTIYSKSLPLHFDLKRTHFAYNTEKQEIIGKRIGAILDGTEFFPSPWETIPSDLQVAYITVFVPLIATVIAYGMSKRHSIEDFFDWLFSTPRYQRLVRLHNDAHIFQLINGKKISGIIEALEGRSTFRVFVLTEVREWDKDNWGDVLPTEVRVPQNQIEMYYKAHS